MNMSIKTIIAKLYTDREISSSKKPNTTKYQLQIVSKISNSIGNFISFILWFSRNLRECSKTQYNQNTNYKSFP